MPTLINRLSGNVLRLLRNIEWSGPLLVRLVVGFAFVLTGWGKLHNLEFFTGVFRDLGIPAPAAQAAMVATIEFAGGILLILGLGTRIVAGLLTGVMVVAFLTAILPKADSWLDLPSSIELTYLAIFVWLVVSGAGAVSLDRLISRARGTAVGEPA